MADFSEDTSPDDKVSAGEATQKKWLAVIDQYDRAFNEWHQRCRKLWKIYTEERRVKEGTNTNRKLSLFWSNISTLQPAVYAKLPEPSVNRRFKDDDPVARQTGEIMERCITFQFADCDMDHVMRQVRDEFLICARGTAWARYEPELEGLSDEDGNALNEKGEPLGEDEAQGEKITFERVVFDHVHWRDFGHNVARTWKEVSCVWRKAYMTRAEGVKRFGEKFKKIELDQRIPENGDQSEIQKDTRAAAENKATVYELWDKVSQKVYFLAKGAQEPLEVVDPLLELRDFFPCPPPVYGSKASDSLIPTPDYVYYQDQIEEIDDLTARIGALSDALKLVGLYPAGASDTTEAIIKISTAGTENCMVPIPNWGQFKEGGGTKGYIEWWPVEMVVEVLKGCFETRKQLIDDIYQVTGISDIMRGEGDKEETATAQNLKSQWGSIRIRDRQNALAVFARDCARIVAEVVATRFQPETLMQMSNIQLPTQADVEQQAMLQAQQQMAQQAAQQQQAQIAQQEAQPA